MLCHYIFYHVAKLLVKADLVKTLKVSKRNHKRLTRIGQWGEPMDNILGRILDSYEKIHKLEPLPEEDEDEE